MKRLLLFMPRRILRQQNISDFPVASQLTAVPHQKDYQRVAIEQAINTHSVNTLAEYRAVWELSQLRLARAYFLRRHVRSEVRGSLGNREIESDQLVVDIMCSDGRIDPLRVYGMEAMRHEIFAVPGSIILPAELRARGLSTYDVIESVLDNVPELRAKVFASFESRWGAVIAKAIKNHQPVHVNVFSHYDLHNPKEAGCGAHYCHTTEAQLETAMNAHVLEYWLEKRFGPDVKKSKVPLQVNRLAYDTHNGTPAVVDAKITDARFGCRDRVHAVLGHLSDAPKQFVIPEPQKENPLQIIEDSHYELGICISNKPQLHMLTGLAMFKLAWQENIDDMVEQIILLMSIAKRKYLAKNPHKPFFLHLDIPEGDKRIKALAANLQKNMNTQPKVTAMLHGSPLLVFVSETNADTGTSIEL